MAGRRTGPSWPYLWLLVGLLALCLTAPRSWERPGGLQARRGSGNGDSPTSSPTSSPASSSDASPVPTCRLALEQHELRPSVAASVELPALAPLAEATITRADIVPNGLAATVAEPDSVARQVAGPIVAKLAPEEVAPSVEAIVARRRRAVASPAWLGLACGGYEWRVSLERLAAQADVRAALETERFAWRPSRAMPGPVVVSLDVENPEPVAPLEPLVEELAQTSEPSAPPANPVAAPAESRAPQPWPTPASLLAALERWTCHPLAGEWAYRAQTAVNGLVHATADLAALDRELIALAALVAEGEQVAERLSSATDARDLRRAGDSLRRHMDAWRLALVWTRERAAQPPASEWAGVDGPWGAWLAANFAGRDGGPLFWQQYLVWQAIEARREARAQAAETTQADPVRDLLTSAEQYAASGDATAGRRLALALAELRTSDDAELRDQAARVDEDYRGINLRTSIHARLVERLSTTRAPLVQGVRRTVSGVPVQGTSVTNSDVRLRLVPDADSLRVAIEATGQIASRTSSRTGPALLFNRSDAQFRVRQELELALTGVRSDAAEVLVNSSTRLRGVESTLDWVPVLGSVTRGIIRNQYDQRRHLAQRETQSLVHREVRERVEQESRGQLAEFNRQLHDRLQTPLARLGLVPAVSSETTLARMTLRARLATDRQLAAATPRPRAPADSWASLQIHESAVNNVVAQLGLEGRRLTLSELHALVSEKFNLPAHDAPAHMPRDVFVTFARDHAAQLRLADGRVKLTLRLAAVDHQSDHWRNFEVYVYYRPDLSTPHGQMLRDGVVQLAGPRLRAKGQVALRGIFSKIFAKDKPLALWPAGLVDDPRFADLAVTQLVVEDGWLGWALAQRTASQTASDAEPAPADNLARRRGLSRAAERLARLATRPPAPPATPAAR